MNASSILVLASAFQNEPAAPQGGGLLNMFGPIALIIAIFWFVLIRPERKKQQERDAMLKAMKKNDEVMTTSGMFGRVVQIQDDVVTLQVADGVRLRFNRAAIQTVIGDEPKSKDDKGNAKSDKDEKSEKVAAS